VPAGSDSNDGRLEVDVDFVLPKLDILDRNMMDELMSIKASREACGELSSFLL